jgi:CheY-like chemotaxis protein
MGGNILPVQQFDILLVDDSAADAKIFQEALREASTRATAYWVGSGEEALDYLTQRGRFMDAVPVKMVVLDLNMPGIDGVETLRRIKSSTNMNHIPVVLLSSSRAPDTVDLAYALGANAYFSKPLSLEHYVEKIRVLVEHWLDFAELPSPVRSRKVSIVRAEAEAFDDEGKRSRQR